MYFALVNYVGSCESMTGLSFGTLEDIREELLDSTKLSIDVFCEGMTREEMEEEGDMLDSYYLLLEDDKCNADIIANYYVTLLDSSIEVGALTDDYQKLVQLFVEYAEDKPILADWMLPENIEITKDNLDMLDTELRQIGDSYYEENFKLMVRREED